MGRRQTGAGRTGRFGSGEEAGPAGRAGAGARRTAAGRALLGAALLAGGAGLSSPAPGDPVPTFEAEVRYVEVDTTVTDAEGNFVRDLRQEEFEILEDGKPQPIAAFTVVDIPIEREGPAPGPRPAPEPDVQTNARPFQGRVYVMVIDDVHTRFSRTAQVRRTAREFIERRLADNDLMAVLHTSGRTDASQEFTSSKRLLLAAVDRTMGRKLASATANRAEQYALGRATGRPGERVADPEDAERSHRARATLQTLEKVASWFSGLRGRRKSILFVSEGIDYDVTNPFESPDASEIREDTRRVIAAATRANVSIYGIDPRGLTSLGDEEIEIGSYPDDPSQGIDHGSLMTEMMRSQISLRAISEDTGGFAVVNANDMREAFARIVKDNSSYYVLAYDPPAGRQDGRFHRIEVRVTRPGLKVQARKGYVAVKAKPDGSGQKARDRKADAAPGRVPAADVPERVREALDSPLPVSGLTLSVFAAPFAGEKGKASVLLGTEVRGSDLRLEAGNKVLLTYLAVDAGGEVREPRTETVVLNLQPETRARVEKGVLRLLSRLELPHGRYQLRVAAQDAATSRLGSVLYDLEVPDFARADLALSGVALAAASASASPTARPDELMKEVLPAQPTTSREFPRGDQLLAYAEVYARERRRPPAADVDVSLLAEDGNVVFHAQEDVSAPLRSGQGRYGFTTRVPLLDVAPGRYVLRVEARARGGGHDAAVREVPFSVAAPGR